MSTSDHAILTQPARHIEQSQFEVRWSSLVHARHDTFDMSENGVERPAQGHHTVLFVLSIQLLAGGRAIFEAWIEFPEGRRTVLPRLPLACVITSEDDMLHVDSVQNDRRLIALSMHGDGRIAYAQSDLLAEAGFRGGSYDPPTVRQLEVGRGAASA